jgi:hypothetical protein
VQTVNNNDKVASVSLVHAEYMPRRNTAINVVNVFVTAPVRPIANELEKNLSLGNFMAAYVWCC